MVQSQETEYQAVSPSDFFYRNREIAGFSNPSRAIYVGVREILENSLDACESAQIPPDIYVRLTELSSSGGENGTAVYLLRIQDNGTGVPSDEIPACFAQVFYGSKYTLKQNRGTFGMGGKMTILYGQITTHKPVVVTSSTGDEIHEYEMMMDIQKNQPQVLRHTTLANERGWRGTIVELQIEGDYPRIMSRMIEYLRQTAMVNPYADLTFVDPKNRLYRFERGTTQMPPVPLRVKPHPHGIDVETLRRMLLVTKAREMKHFMIEQFQGVGPKTTEKYLEFAQVKPETKPASLQSDDIVKLVRAAKEFQEFYRPDASCLSPIGPDLLETGIRKELNLTEADFIKTVQRPPATYSGYPFIVEAAVVAGPTVRKIGNGITLYRFANRIPLLFDESSCVTYKVISKDINWKTYNVQQETPLIVAIHLCSTKIPYKSVGKEFLADQVEVEKEITNAIREAARDLRIFISRSVKLERQKHRLNIFGKYLPKIAEFASKLGEKPDVPDIQKLLNEILVVNQQEEGEENSEENGVLPPPDEELIEEEGEEKEEKIDGEADQ
ncbi:TPA: DNA topoisomerase VI subunit B [Candidatus Bathyarchaeota archaeon]|nr:DNA topoisomerase VI subunit B [Candidatus Bathyarchaeota archaeon]